MNYKVSLSQVTKVLNPFSEEMGELFINPNQIHELINSGKIFPENDDSEHIRFIKKIAYEVANYVPEEISISIPSEGIDNPEELVTSGLVNLYAAIYLNKSNVVISFQGDEKIIETLFVVNLNNPDNIELPKKAKVERVTWTLVQDLLQTNWSDPEFVIDHIFYGNSNIMNNMKEALALASSDMWDDSNFIENILNHKEVKTVKLKDALKSNFPDEFFYTSGLYSLIYSNAQYFSNVWEAHFEPKIELLKDNVPQEIWQQIPQHKKSLYQKIKSEIFTDLTKVCNIILHSEGTGIYEILPKEIKYHKDLLDFIYNPQNPLRPPEIKTIYVYPHAELEKQEHLVQDYEWMKHYVINYSEHLQLDTIPGKDNDNFSSRMPRFMTMFSSFLNNKERLLEICTDVKNERFYNVFKIIDPNLQEDKEVINAFMKVSPHTYRHLPENLKLDYVVEYINAIPNEILNQVRMLSSEEITGIEDREVLKNLIVRGKNRWLTHKNCPQKWQEDLELLLLIQNPSELISDGNEKIFSTLIEDAASLIKILRDKPSLYYKLPTELQNEKEIIHLVLQKNGNLPNHLFANKEFCIEALQITSNAFKRIPQGYWQEKNFVLDILEKIDTNKISSTVIEKLPQELTQIFTAFGVDKNYTNFLQNYLLNIELTQKFNNVEKLEAIKKKKI